MIYVFVLGGFCLFMAVGIGGYYVGRYEAQLINEIKKLQSRELPPEPEKPTVTGGAYQPPRDVGSIADKKQGAGLVETKTPERLDWENKNELARLERGA
jgi:hypothetical protein